MDKYDGELILDFDINDFCPISYQISFLTGIFVQLLFQGLLFNLFALCWLTAPASDYFILIVDAGFQLPGVNFGSGRIV